MNPQEIRSCPFARVRVGPVNRNRRNAAIASIARSSVRLATTRGAEMDQPCSSTRPTIRRRCLNDKAASACNFSRDLLGRESLGSSQPPGRPGLNNLLSNYT